MFVKRADLLQGTLTRSRHSGRYEGKATTDKVASLQRSSSIYLEGEDTPIKTILHYIRHFFFALVKNSAVTGMVDLSTRLKELLV
jgi:hypothetical protein